MEGESLRRAPRKYSNGWMTVLALGLLAMCLLACLYVLIGFPAQAQVTGSTVEYPNGSPAAVPAAPVRRYSPAYAAQVPAPDAPAAPVSAPLVRRYSPAYTAPAPPPAAPAPAISAARSEMVADALQAEVEAVRDQLQRSEENLRQAARVQRRIRTISAIFLGVFSLVASLIVLQVYLQARAWDREGSRAVAEVEAIATQLDVLRESRNEAAASLPGLLQEVGELPLIFQEEGSPFSPRALTILEDIDHLAYVGQGRLAFRDLASEPEAAVYLNGLLLSAVAGLTRNDPWTATARLDQFFRQLSRFPNALERRRVAQAYSYRALAAYQVLDAQDREPSWLRKTDRAQLESMSKQAFADVARANSIDSEWRHAHFVEALLCSRVYLSDEASDKTSRSELHVRGLRRAVSLYKGLIDERAYRGPARRNLVRALKRIAEQTGDKSDFSDFGYALNAFPSDEELADEALAARQPTSQDRFLWQWMLGDDELFANVESLNQAEYRAFWIRMLDNKVHLRNWRADLSELQQTRPAIKDWTIQLLQAEPPISLSNAISRRQERFDTPAPGA